MTREEAKELLLHILMTYEPKDQYGDYDDPEPYEQALTMAIEALSAEYEDYEHATLVDIKEPLVKHDREWIIGCIKHDGFIHTHRFDKANQIILEALQNEQRWIPFKKRLMTDEEREEYPDWAYIFDCPLPEDEEEILLTNGVHVWTDTFINDGECYLDGGDDIDDDMAWMPMPKPYIERREL